MPRIKPEGSGASFTYDSFCEVFKLVPYAKKPLPQPDIFDLRLNFPKKFTFENDRVDPLYAKRLRVLVNVPDLLNILFPLLVSNLHPKTLAYFSMHLTSLRDAAALSQFLSHSDQTTGTLVYSTLHLTPPYATVIADTLHSI